MTPTLLLFLYRRYLIVAITFLVAAACGAFANWDQKDRPFTRAESIVWRIATGISLPIILLLERYDWSNQPYAMAAHNFGILSFVIIDRCMYAALFIALAVAITGGKSAHRAAQRLLLGAGTLVIISEISENMILQEMTNFSGDRFALDLSIVEWIGMIALSFWVRRVWPKAPAEVGK